MTPGIFETMIRFTSSTSNTVFNPTCSEIKDIITNIFNKVTETVVNLQRVGHINIKPIASSTSNNGNSLLAGYQLNNYSVTANIKTILLENKQFRLIIENLHQRILIDFENAEDYAVSYDAIRPIYQFISEWSIDKYKSDGYDISNLKFDLELITSWIKYLEKLKNKSFGIVDVDSRKLKNELTPILESKLFEIKEYIKDMAKQRSISLLNYYKDCIAKLTNRPNVLKDFSNQIALTLTLKDEEMNYFIQTSQVDSMYNLLQLYDVAIPSENVVLHEELNEKQHEYRKEIQQTIVFHENKRSEMVVNLNKYIQKHEKNIEQFLEKLDDPNFTKTLHYDDSDTIIEDLDLQTEDYEELFETTATFQRYQKLLCQPIKEYKSLEDGLEKLNITKKLWTAIQSWNEYSEEWNRKPFYDLNVEEIEKEVNGNFYKQVMVLSKLNECNATNKLKDEVITFKNKLPCILDLGNKNMKPRHFEVLFQCVNKAYYPGMPFTLFEVDKQWGLLKYKDIISEISATASGEAALEDSLNKIKTGWDKLRFIVKSHRDQHGLYILGTLEEIYQQLEDHQVLLQTMLGSRFIKGLQDQVEIWEKRLSSLSEILDEWVNILLYVSIKIILYLTYL